MNVDFAAAYVESKSFIRDMISRPVKPRWGGYLLFFCFLKKVEADLEFAD
jgi:hypothetical protein